MPMKVGDIIVENRSFRRATQEDVDKEYEALRLERAKKKEEAKIEADKKKAAKKEAKAEAKKYARKQLPKTGVLPFRVIMYDQKLQDGEIPPEESVVKKTQYTTPEQPKENNLGNPIEDYKEMTKLKQRERARKNLVRANTRKLLGTKPYPRILVFNRKSGMYEEIRRR
ncbi:MAG: hypothetical protein IJT54_04480 [Candidatus Methanomethylophilaceae archaeon]|nr:hypothetical protein [Candidatus Methanomethylophilaceae archaeon]